MLTAHHIVTDSSQLFSLIQAGLDILTCPLVSSGHDKMENHCSEIKVRWKYFGFRDSELHPRELLFPSSVHHLLNHRDWFEIYNCIGSLT